MPDGASQLSDTRPPPSSLEAWAPADDRSVAALASHHVAGTIRAIPVFAVAALLVSATLAAASWRSAPLWALCGWLAVIGLAIGAAV